MNKPSYVRYILGLAFSVIVLMGASCSETIDTSKERRSENEKAFNAYKDNKDFQRVSLAGDFGDRYVYMQWQHKAQDRSRMPKFTDYIRMRYTGKLLTTKQAFERVDAENISTLNSMQVSSLVPGVAIALQSMAIGDKATVAMPWFLAYGDAIDKPIPPYSALLFDIELVEITQEEN